MAECASADLTIEVRQVRINANDDDALSAPSGRGERLPNQQSPNASAAEDLFQYDVDVELFGIVYIYNPVDNGILGIAEEETVPVDEAPAEAAPADETAAAK